MVRIGGVPANASTIHSGVGGAAWTDGTASILDLREPDIERLTG
jgi:hypothetical protein